MTPAATSEVTTRTAGVTTMRTTAAGTACTNSVTLVEPLRIPTALATTWVDCFATAIAITKKRNAEIHITETARAFGIARPPNRPPRALISADIMTSKSDSVSTIRALAATIAGITSVTDRRVWISHDKLVPISQDITFGKVNLDDTAMPAISTNSTAAIGSATHAFRRHITRALAFPSEVITHTTIKDATIIPSPVDIKDKDSATTSLSTVGQNSSATRPEDTMSVPMDSVTSLTTTALTSFRLTENVSPTRRRPMSAIHADCLVGCCTLADAITTATVRSHCFPPATGNATKIVRG